MGNLLFKRATLLLVATGLTTGTIPVHTLAAQSAKPKSPPAIEMVSKPVVQPLPGDPPASPAAAAEPAPPVAAAPPPDETPEARKARLKAEKAAAREAERAQKQAAREEQKRLKAEEKARRQAENKARGGGGGRLGKALLGCALGALAGGLLAGRGNRGAGILAGCALGAGAGLAFAALSERDNKELANFVEDDFALRDDECASNWTAPESGKTVSVSCGQTTYVQANHKLYMENDVVLDQTNFVVAEAMKYSTASIRLRSSPSSADNANIIGGYERGAKLRTYGTTSDGKWSYVVDRLPDGSYELLGYVATGFLSDTAPTPEARQQKFARPDPAKGKENRAAIQRAAAPAAAPAAAAAKPVRQASFAASTRCKQINVNVGNETKSTSRCGGSALAMLIPNTHGNKRTA
jgi:uncharacterized protein YcfJ